MPELGQASTVFSLSALFGAYLGIHLLLGAPAVLGLATGTVVALFLIRRWIERQGAHSFDGLLFELFNKARASSRPLLAGLIFLQCAYAASELLILQAIADSSFGLRSDHATLISVAVGVMAYLYVLMGGYMAVFRTDILQFLLVSIMAMVAFVVSTGGLTAGETTLILPRPGYWMLGDLSPGPLLYAYHFLLGLVIGSVFLICSPDAWKRIFLVVSSSQHSRRRFIVFVAAGTLPFLLLLGVDKITASIPDGPFDAGGIWVGLLTNNLLFLAAFLSLVASFLSAFNGSLLGGVHLWLIDQRIEKPVSNESSRFHWLMVAGLLTIFMLFAAVKSFGNAYLVGNLLLGPYMAVAGIIIGSDGLLRRLPRASVIWIFVVSQAAWLIYLLRSDGLPQTTSTYQVNTGPVGVLIFAASFVVTRLLNHLGASNDD